MAAPRRRCPSLASMEMDAESTCACVLQEPRTPEIGRGELRVRLRTALCRCVSRSLWSAKVLRSPVASLAPKPGVVGLHPERGRWRSTGRGHHAGEDGQSATGASAHLGGPARGRGRCHRSARRAGGAGRPGREASEEKGGGAAGRRGWGPGVSGGRPGPALSPRNALHLARPALPDRKAPRGQWVLGGCAWPPWSCGCSRPQSPRSGPLLPWV